jgi:hypothetical protein
VNTAYLIPGIAFALLGAGRFILSDLPWTAERQAGHALPLEQADLPDAQVPPEVLVPVLTGTGMILVGAGAVAGAWANTGPGPMNAANVVSVVLFGPGFVLAIGRSYLSRRLWLRHLAARLFLRKANGQRPAAAAGSRTAPQRESTRFRNMALYSPRQRIRTLLAGVVMSVVSLLLLAAGLSDPPSGAVVIVVGGIGALFFAPLTIYALVGIISLRKRP